MSAEKASEVLNANALAYACPKCGEPAGEKCRKLRSQKIRNTIQTPNAWDLDKPHRERQRLANDRRTVLVTSFGYAYRLTVPAWRSWLVAHAAGKEPSLENYGVWIGQLENVTDLSAEDATDKLAELDRELEADRAEQALRIENTESH